MAGPKELPMPLTARPADARRLYHQVADRIRELIEREKYQAGTRLPPERELAQRLEVSRPSLREALIALEIEGRIEIRMGSGVYVCDAPALPRTDPPAGDEDPATLVQARTVLESGVIALAAARVAPLGMERLKHCLDTMRHDVQRGHSPVEAERRFHVAIAELAGNPLLARMVGELFDRRYGAVASRTVHPEERQRGWMHALKEHEAIYRALEARDPLLATAALCVHLQASRDRWMAESAASAGSAPQEAPDRPAPAIPTLRS
jgi:DNA-binding FadR family transcriptional regulator